ncbi:hypothetical protein N7532_009311 [Penicillium argentinense]|uniref:Phospholipase/carboxylesterase/thioesterase domain-containing protein n=1 Tax=Penicillium argentinense TaxID=1131581 RepID=A0A9W9EZ43_9EURO|nr:uncharacterized protein N7532_009311 [Penicillium argentinense]KAJ5090627.1 hypothetical protein N7532_009311 [Penicillium argentinense]
MSFPPPHIQLPKTEHTHTIIFLHGLGTNFPTCKWVFPTAPDRWRTVLGEEQYAWFDVYSLDDTTERSELQVDGLRESILYILDLIEAEARLLNDEHDKIYLGGSSQGMAIALWTIFGAVATGRIRSRLAGVLGICGWLPFAENLESSIVERKVLEIVEKDKLVFDLFNRKFGRAQLRQSQSPMDGDVLPTPMFLSHWKDNAFVSLQLGLQAYQF